MVGCGIIRVWAGQQEQRSCPDLRRIMMSEKIEKIEKTEKVASYWGVSSTKKDGVATFVGPKGTTTVTKNVAGKYVVVGKSLLAGFDARVVRAAKEDEKQDFRLVVPAAAWKIGHPAGDHEETHDKLAFANQRAFSLVCEIPAPCRYEEAKAGGSFEQDRDWKEFLAYKEAGLADKEDETCKKFAKFDEPNQYKWFFAGRINKLKK